MGTTHGHYSKILLKVSDTPPENPSAGLFWYNPDHCITTTTTTVEPTTTTTTTTLLCEPMICDTTLTVGTDGNGNYGFLRGFVGSISPDCESVNVVGYIDSQGLLGVVLIDYVCDVTLWINGVEYELTYFGYIPEYGGNAYFIPLVPNPFPSIGETCNVAICGTECTTTTTTTEEPTTTTTTTTLLAAQTANPQCTFNVDS